MQGEPQWDRIRQQAKPRDLLVIAGFPLLLIRVFLLPERTRVAFTFAHSDPTVITAYTAHFVHLRSSHLLGNLGGSLVIIPMAYLLCTAAGRRQTFYIVVGSILLVFPGVLSVLSLLLFERGQISGSSGLLLAVVGFLPLAIGAHAHTQFDTVVGRDDSSGVFLIGLALIGWRTPLPTARRIGIVAGVLGFVYIGLTLWRIQQSTAGVRAFVEYAITTELPILGGVVFVGSLVTAFPSNPASNSVIVNIYLHLLGYSLGYIAPYATISLGNWLSRRSYPPIQP